MDLKALRKLRSELQAKQNRTADEDELLKELNFLASLINSTQNFSLSLSTGVCPTCGRKLP